RRRSAAGSRAVQCRPAVRLGLPAGADRRGRHRRSFALGRAGERDVDLDRGAGAHLPHPDADRDGSLGGDAVRRLRGRNPRRNGRFRRPRRHAARPVATHLQAAAPVGADGRARELTLERRSQPMHARKESQMRRKRPALVALVVLAVAVTIAATASGGATTKGPSGWVAKSSAMTGSGGGFGEVYKAPTATLAKMFFHANLLPANKTARNITLASIGRSTKPVDYALALKCWKNNGCSTGTGGKLTVAY